MDYKGITEGVWFGTQFLFDWTIYPLPMEDLGNLQLKEIDTDSAVQYPAFHRGTLEVDEPI